MAAAEGAERRKDGEMQVEEKLNLARPDKT